MESRAENAPSRSWLRTALIGRNPKRTLVRIIILAVAAFLVPKFLLLPIRVQGASMLPTYKETGINFVNRLSYRWSDPKRGDVVAIRLAGEHIMFMKRIIGLPGEKVAFHRGKAFVNGQPLWEPYLKFPCDWEYPEVELGPDMYFFVGDNRSMPQADHEFGRGERRRIVGKVLL
jgi:signal peptidase I